VRRLVRSTRRTPAQGLLPAPAAHHKLLCDLLALLARADVGYLDALTVYYFKTARDGRRVYFPMSFRGRGYVMSSEQDFQRLQSQIKTGPLVSLVLIFGFSLLVSHLASYVVAGLLVGFYTIWSRYRIRGMQPSEEGLERLPLKERLAFQAQAHSSRSLWFLEISSLVFVCGAILMLFEACRVDRAGVLREWRGAVWLPARAAAT
jgi:hypothetical protein